MGVSLSSVVFDDDDDDDDDDGGWRMACMRASSFLPLASTASATGGGVCNSHTAPFPLIHPPVDGGDSFKNDGAAYNQPLLLHLYMNTQVFPKSIHKSTPGIPHHPKKKDFAVMPGLVRISNRLSTSAPKNHGDDSATFFVAGLPVTQVGSSNQPKKTTQMNETRMREYEDHTKEVQKRKGHL